MSLTAYWGCRDSFHLGPEKWCEICGIRLPEKCPSCGRAREHPTVRFGEGER